MGQNKIKPIFYSISSIIAAGKKGQEILTRSELLPENYQFITDNKIPCTLGHCFSVTKRNTLRQD